MCGGTVIPESSDLDNYKTIGNYSATYASAQSLNNAPWKDAFIMKIDYAVATDYPRQTCINYHTQQRAIRYFNQSWTNWVYFSDDATLTAFRSVNANSEESNTVSFNVIKSYGAALVITAYEIFAISWESSGSPRAVYYEKLTNTQTDNLEITGASVSGSIMTLTFNKIPWSGVVVYQ